MDRRPVRARDNAQALRLQMKGLEPTRMQIVDRNSETGNGAWLPDMDLNHDKQIQSLLCYRYTIGQSEALDSLSNFAARSSRALAPRLTPHASP